MFNQFEPINDQILIEPDTEDQVSKGGITLIGSPNDFVVGVIKAVGVGHLTTAGDRVALRVTKGDKVAFRVNSGTPITVADKKCLIIREGDIFGLVS